MRVGRDVCINCRLGVFVSWGILLRIWNHFQIVYRLVLVVSEPALRGFTGFFLRTVLLEEIVVPANV